MLLLVTGRAYVNAGIVKDALDALHTHNCIRCVIVNATDAADVGSIAWDWALSNNISVSSFADNVEQLIGTHEGLHLAAFPGTAPDLYEAFASRDRAIWQMPEGVRLFLHASPSQIETFEDCKRKWYLSRIIGFAQTTLPFNVRGSAVHYALEQYTLQGLQPAQSVPLYFARFEGTPPYPPTYVLAGRTMQSTPLAELQKQAIKIAEAMLQHAPQHGTQGVWCEQDFKLPTNTVPVLGYIDVFERGRVGDYKVRSSPKQHALGTYEGNQLLPVDEQKAPIEDSVQMNVYGMVNLCTWPDQDYVDVEHVYASSKGAPAPFAVRARLTKDHILNKWHNHIVPTVQDMARTAALREEEVPQTLASCSKYGGCEFKDRCFASRQVNPIDAMFALGGVATSPHYTQGTAMAFDRDKLLEQIRNGNPPPPPPPPTGQVAAPPVPVPAAPPPPPAPAPATPADPQAACRNMVLELSAPQMLALYRQIMDPQCAELPIATMLPALVGFLSWAYTPEQVRGYVDWAKAQVPHTPVTNPPEHSTAPIGGAPAAAPKPAENKATGWKTAVRKMLSANSRNTREVFYNDRHTQALTQDYHKLRLYILNGCKTEDGKVKQPERNALVNAGLAEFEARKLTVEQVEGMFAGIQPHTPARLTEGDVPPEVAAAVAAAGYPLPPTPAAPPPPPAPVSDGLAIAEANLRKFPVVEGVGQWLDVVAAGIPDTVLQTMIRAQVVEPAGASHPNYYRISAMGLGSWQKAQANVAPPPPAPVVAAPPPPPAPVVAAPPPPPAPGVAGKPEPFEADRWIRACKVAQSVNVVPLHPRILFIDCMPTHPEGLPTGTVDFGAMLESVKARVAKDLQVELYTQPQYRKGEMAVAAYVQRLGWPEGVTHLYYSTEDPAFEWVYEVLRTQATMIVRGARAAA